MSQPQTSLEPIGNPLGFHSDMTAIHKARRDAAEDAVWAYHLACCFVAHGLLEPDMDAMKVSAAAWSRSWITSRHEDLQAYLVFGDQGDAYRRRLLLWTQAEPEASDFARVAKLR